MMKPEDLKKLRENVVNKAYHADNLSSGHSPIGDGVGSGAARDLFDQDDTPGLREWEREHGPIEFIATMWRDYGKEVLPDLEKRGIVTLTDKGRSLMEAVLRDDENWSKLEPRRLHSEQAEKEGAMRRALRGEVREARKNAGSREKTDAKKFREGTPSGQKLTE